VNKYQGEQNGVTKAFTTSYFYKINSDGMDDFFPALADAIEHPTFTEENILKEVNNVNSEISMRMTYNKNLAYYKLLKTIGNPNSRIYSDGFANIDVSTLNITQLRQKIVDFHNQHYSANIMTLAVVTDEDFKVVRRQIESSFSQITDRNVARPLFNETGTYEIPLQPSVIGQIFYLKAFTAPTKLTMVFQLGSDLRDPHFLPIEFFSTFLNYFAEHSLKEILIREGLITGFYDTVSYEDYVTSLYTVSFQLTDKGRQNTSQILKHFYRFVRFVKEIPNKENIFDALAKTSKYSFLFNVKSKFINFSNIQMELFERVLKFSENLQDYPPEMIFSANNILFKYNQTSFDQVLSLIHPLNAVYMIEDPEFKDTTGHPHRKTRQVAEGVKRLGGVRTKKTRKLHLNENQPELPNTRILATIELSASAEPPKDYRVFFDVDPSSVVLDSNLNFDNNRPYAAKTIPKDALTQLATEVDVMSSTYDTNTVFDTAHLDYYDVVSTCPVPETLKRPYIHERDENSTVITISDQTEVERNVASTQHIFSAIFNDSEKPLPSSEQLVYLRDLLSYKLCLVKESADDDKKENAIRAHQETRLSVYHSLYRKTLQPKCIVNVVIEPEVLLEGVTSLQYRGKLERLMQLEVLCSYLSKHFELKLHDQYIKGNDFGCRIENFRMVLTFEGITSQIETFVMTVLGNFLKMTNGHSFDAITTGNIKQKMVDGYSQFKSITSIKLSMYYLSLFMDKMSVDYSTDQKLAEIQELVNSISEDDLARTLTDVLSSNNIVVLGVGNIEEARVVQLGQRARTMLRSSTATMKTDFNVLKYRSYMQQNFVTNIEFNEHLVVRMENMDKKESNNAYVSFFRIHRVTRGNKLQSLILNHLLQKVVFEELRNKRNLGYVAQSAVRSYYHNLGLIILVQGESFRPNAIEDVVDKIVAEFLENLEKMDSEEFGKAKDSVLNELNEFSQDLPQVSQKFFVNMDEQILEEGDQTYSEIAESVSTKSLYLFAKDFLINKPRRLTIELFAKEVTIEEQAFRLNPQQSLDKKPYEVVTLEALMERKMRANHQFKK
jgi:secreted Zn-dependent insulinase-like peptidase